MRKRMLKYNLITIMLIVLIPTIYGLSTYFESASSLNIPNDNQEIIDTTPVEKPTVSGDNQNENNTVKPPQFRTGIQAVEYAIKVLTQPISFECDVYHNTSCASVGSLNVLFKTYRYKNHEMMRIWTECSVPVEAGNFYKMQYSNCEQEQIRLNNDSKRFDLETKMNTFNDSDKIEGERIEQYIESDKVCGWNGFFTDVNNSVAREIYFDKSETGYYKIKVSLIQSKLNESRYASTMINQGALGVDFKKLDMTFTIDKKTGYMLTCTREEEFVINIGTAEMLYCKAKGVQTYRYVDTKDTIVNLAKQELNVGY